jgi:hypothetical protein
MKRPLHCCNTFGVEKKSRVYWAIDMSWIVGKKIIYFVYAIFNVHFWMESTHVIVVFKIEGKEW